MKRESFDRYVSELLACRSCPNVFGEPVFGPVFGARVMLVGQAPGSREVEDRRPFAFTAGRRLFSWFERLGVPESEFRKRVHISAVIRCFPGKDVKAKGDRVPSKEEITECARHLDREIMLLEPQLVISVGTLSAMQLVGSNQLADLVGRQLRAERAGRSFDVIVLPHPSGRSTWLNKPENAKKLDAALELIQHHPAWQKTFRKLQPIVRP